MKISKPLLKYVINQKGNALVEFALILPALLLFLSGVFEISMYALLNNKLVRIAGTISNLVSMQNLNRTTLNAIIATAPDMAQPVPFTGKGDVIVSLIYNKGQTTDPTKMNISWQASSSTSVFSNFGTPGQFPKNLPNNITVTDDQTLVITEVFYNYTPYIFTGVIAPQTLTKTAVYVPRQGNMVTLLTP